MQIMTHDQIRAVAPAAFAEEAAGHMSDRYGFINTMNVVEALADTGYLPVQADQDKPRRRSINHVRHRIVLRHEDQIAEVGEEVPQIILLNSHNGRTKLHMRAGIYRFVCANGMVVGDDRFRGAVGHWSDARAEALAFAEDMTGRIDDLRRVKELWSELELSAQKAREFAEQAAQLRFGSEKAKQYEAEDLLAARREEDDGRTLWQVYNIIQENTTKGGIKGTTGGGRRVQSRELTGVGTDVAFNERLWELASEFAEA